MSNPAGAEPLRPASAAPSPDEDNEATVIVPASEQARYFAAARDAGAATTPPHTGEPRTQPSAPPSPPDTSASRVERISTTLPGREPGTEPRSGSLPGTTMRQGELVTRQVGRYEVRDCLGRGGMATVYRAHDPDISRDVAIKFLHASLCEDEDCRERFLREARAAGGLSHPNIVVVYDVGQIEGRPYMAMELLEGHSLADVLSEGKSLPIRDAVVMGIQLARALDYAHNRGIVHRDIKPGNIVQLRGGNTIKVTDFGIAHMEVGQGEQRTRSGEVLGTPQYMSPEQTVGDKIDGRSDLFSTGVVLYQMVTGQRPFQGDTMVAVALKIAKEQPTPIDKLRPEVPAALRRIVDRCLAKAPGQRYQTGKELAEDLVKLLGDIDEAAAAKNRPRIVPLRVKWALTMGLIVAVVMGLTGAVTTSRQNAALTNQLADNGAALSRFIAAQNAVSALSEDWVAVDVSLQEIMKTGDFASITVIDRQGVVRAASNQSLVGKPYQSPPGETLDGRGGKVKMTRYIAPAGSPVAGDPVLGFESPITFAGKQVGRVNLALPEAPLMRVVHVSILMMAILVLVTVVAVAVAMYFVANWFAQPIKLVAEAMGQVGKGRFDHRIHETRKDEFGHLYQAFDQMAQALQDRASGAAVTPPPGAGTPG